MHSMVGERAEHKGENKKTIDLEGRLILAK
jgi:hypothetical protein